MCSGHRRCNCLCPGVSDTQKKNAKRILNVLMDTVRYPTVCVQGCASVSDTNTRTHTRTHTRCGARTHAGLIYPVPDPSVPFLGVHFTPTMGSVTTAVSNRQVCLLEFLVSYIRSLPPCLPPSLSPSLPPVGGAECLNLNLKP